MTKKTPNPSKDKMVSTCEPIFPKILTSYCRQNLFFSYVLGSFMPCLSIQLTNQEISTFRPLEGMPKHLHLQRGGYRTIAN